MKYSVSYLGRSQIVGNRSAQQVSLAPNLSRDPVAFDAGLVHPLRFREAISALHDVVVSDLRYQPRDKTAYQEWKKTQQQREAKLYREELKQAKEKLLKKSGIDKELEARFQSARKKYWKLRQKYSNYLLRHDPELWRHLMPCDPVITVGEDVVFFECFSADESSYGCLTADRDAFGKAESFQYGTTNVDYSWALYDHFQSLRSYRETRFQVDPEGFEVKTTGTEDYREEKIDLPQGWLRGFMQIQSAMSLPMRKVTLSRETVYSLLAWMKRHRPKRSPRALRFELLTGQSPKLVMEPWEKEIVSYGTTYQGASCQPVRIWGTRRLMFLSRVLPIADRFDVYLLGTGLPSFWVVKMGEMRLTIGLSGWTANDWTKGSSLDALRPPVSAPKELVGGVISLLRDRKALSLSDLTSELSTDANQSMSALNHLAETGQIIYDLDAGLFRWRQVMAKALGEAELGPENEEVSEGRALYNRRKVKISSHEQHSNGLQILIAEVDKMPVELLMDEEGLIKKGKCSCNHFYRNGLRMGPCRHLLATRLAALQGSSENTSSKSWYDRLLRTSHN